MKKEQYESPKIQVISMEADETIITCENADGGGGFIPSTTVEGFD